MSPELEYDRGSDAVYIRLCELPYAYGEEVDHERRINYGGDGTPIDIGLLDVSNGVNLEDLPERETVARLLEHRSIKLLA